MRLDAYLAEQGLCRSRSRAAVLIRQGLVSVNGSVVSKAAFDVPPGADVRLLGDLSFVGRGALKLERALDQFDISVSDCTCMDVGASTGGFTDCMLRRGAKKVYAVDVGSGQLDPSLASDARVVNFENTNIRYLDPEAFEPIDFVCADVSFISLAHVLPVIGRLLRGQGSAVCLVKPQFEAGREYVGKNGIVKDRKVHIRVLRRVAAEAERCGLFPAGITVSPIKGGDGNTEYLMYLLPEPQSFPENKIESVVMQT